MQRQAVSALRAHVLDAGRNALKVVFVSLQVRRRCRRRTHSRARSRCCGINGSRRHVIKSRPFRLMAAPAPSLLPQLLTFFSDSLDIPWPERSRKDLHWISVYKFDFLVCMQCSFCDSLCLLGAPRVRPRLWRCASAHCLFIRPHRWRLSTQTIPRFSCLAPNARYYAQFHGKLIGTAGAFHRVPASTPREGRKKDGDPSLRKSSAVQVLWPYCSSCGSLAFSCSASGRASMRGTPPRGDI